MKSNRFHTYVALRIKKLVGYLEEHQLPVSEADHLLNALQYDMIMMNPDKSTSLQLVVINHGTHYDIWIEENKVH